MKKWLVAIWGLLVAPFLMFRKDSSGYPACSMHDRPEVPHDLEHQQEIESVFRNAFKSSVFRALERSPLTKLNGDVNPAWFDNLSIGYPELEKEQILILIEQLRAENESVVERFLDGDVDGFSDPLDGIVYDTTLLNILPKVKYDKLTGVMYLMVHRKWNVYDPTWNTRHLL